MFDKMKQLMDMQKKMQEMKRELENTNFQIQSPDGFIKISMNGSQEVQAIDIQGNLQGMDNRQIEEAFKNTFNRAIKRSQDLAREKMKDITGLNIPGLI